MGDQSRRVLIDPGCNGKTSPHSNWNPSCQTKQALEQDKNFIFVHRRTQFLLNFILTSSP